MSKENIKENKYIMEFIRTFHDIIHEVIDIEKHTMYFGTDILLTRQEAHLIKIIKENPGSHVTKLAEISDVTKGAVSQMLVKLEKKKMIKKEEDMLNKSRLIIGLTSKGEVVYKEHEYFHKDFDDVFVSMFNDYTEEEMKFLMDFAEKSSEKLKKFNKVI